MRFRKITSLKLSLLSFFTVTAFADSNSVEQSENESNQPNSTIENYDEFTNRLDEINNLDLNVLTADEKNELIEELLNSNLETLRLIPNREIEMRRYRDEVGSHAHVGH